MYLGITDKDKLLGQLEVLQTKEAQLQKKELFIMGGELCVFAVQYLVYYPFSPSVRNFRNNFPGLFAGHDPARGSGREVFKTSRVGSGRLKMCSISHGSGLVDPRAFLFSWFGSDQEKNLSNLTQKSFKPDGSGRVGSRVYQSSRVGSGRVRP